MVRRPIASVPEFDYSGALRALAQREPVWSAALLDAYLADPEAIAPGTSMTFVGLADAEQRRDLIAFLASVGEAE